MTAKRLRTRGSKPKTRNSILPCLMVRVLLLRIPSIRGGSPSETPSGCPVGTHILAVMGVSGCLIRKPASMLVTLASPRGPLIGATCPRGRCYFKGIILCKGWKMKTIMFFKVRILNIIGRWWLMAQIRSKSQDIIGLRMKSFPTRRKNTKQGSCG